MNSLGETFYERSMDLPDKLLNGAIDIHVHAGPHLKSSPRRVDPFQAAEEARAAGMRAIVLMDVFENSLDMEFTVDEIRALTSLNPARLLGLDMKASVDQGV
jgi:hypothetical protein